VKIRTLTDPDNFTLSSSWTSELVASNRYDEGEYVSLAYTPDDKRLAYRRCKLLTDAAAAATSTTRPWCSRSKAKTVSRWRS
jgi:hypothetical protein